MPITICKKKKKIQVNMEEEEMGWGLAQSVRVTTLKWTLEKSSSLNKDNLLLCIKK